MSQTAIQVENLSKQYRIGGLQPRYKTFREWLTEAAQTPARRFADVVRGKSALGANETIWALKDVSFNVERGEVVGVIGRNGAGKTTLLKILTRVTEPTEGRARIRGRVGSLLEVGTGFHPELTGRENIYLNGAILGMKRAEIEHKFDEMVEFAGVKKFIDTPVKHYSSGMYVRLAFAVAAHLEPDILLVDEVLAVGDAAFQNKCLGKMESVAKQGRTVVFVSHNLAAVSALCSRVVLLDSGKIVADGTTDEVLQLYGATLGNATTSLRELQTRVGNGVLRFTDFGLYDEANNRVEQAASGRYIRFGLAYESEVQDRLRNVDVAIFFRGSLGERLFVCHLQVTQDIFDEIPKRGKFLCSINKLPLPPGRYSLDLWCQVSGIVVDKIEDACELNVVAGDYYGTGRLPAAKHRGLLVEYEWSLQS